FSRRDTKGRLSAYRLILFGPFDCFVPHVPFPTPHPPRFERQPQYPFALPQRLFGLLAIFDVGVRPIPLDDIPLLIELRYCARQEPAVLTVSPPQTYFDLIIPPLRSRFSYRI